MKLIRFAPLLLALGFMMPGAGFAQDPTAVPTEAAPAAEAAAPEMAPAPEPAAAADDYKAPDYNMGNVSWMMTATALVLLMSVPGLALFYGGMVRSKNMLSTLTQTFAIFSLI